MNGYVKITFGITIIINYLPHAVFESAAGSKIYYNVVSIPEHISLHISKGGTIKIVIPDGIRRY